MWGSILIHINKKLAVIACFVPDFRYVILKLILLLPAASDVFTSILHLCK